MVNIIAYTLANALADKNRGLSPVCGNLIASFCQILLARDYLRHFSEHIGRQKPGKYRVYILHYDCQNVISTDRTK
jgi:ribosomal protein S8